MAELSFQSASGRLFTLGSEEDNKEDNLDWYKTLSAWPRSGLTALAIAGVFGVQIYCVSLDYQELNDEKLLHMLSYLHRHCNLLEDIDEMVFQERCDVDDEGVKAGGRKSKQSRISQEGRILVMTTNSPESLPPALLRPGRIDLNVKFGLVSQE